MADSVMESTSKKSMVPHSGYIRELDGLRFFAIASVFLCHLHIPGSQLGWSGVLLFFVLSGYLITGILLAAKSRPHYFRNFYIRRVLRIFPIYYLLLTVLVIVGWLVNRPVGDAPYFFLYLQNYLYGYKGWATEFPRPYAITWSLAVEEQFYLIWPVVVYLLSTRRLVALALLLIPAAIASRYVIWQTFQSSTMVYNSLPSCMDCLVLGGLLAILVRRGITRVFSYKLGLIACLISGICLSIPVSIYGMDHYVHSFLKNTVHFFWLSCWAVFFAGLVAIAVSGIGWFPRILRLRPLVHIGKISYGIYLYHVLCFTVLKWIAAYFSISHGRVFITALGPIFTYLVALASWHLIEKRFLALKDRFTL